MQNSNFNRGGMRGKSAIVLIFLCLFSSFLFGQVCGDVNNSGTADIIDSLMIAQSYAGLNPTGYSAANADVNGDKVITLADALMVSQYYINLITALTGCGTATNAPTSTPTGVITEPTPTIVNTQNLKVQYRCGEIGATSTQIRAMLNIINGSTSAVTLSNLKIRYYYSKEGTAVEDARIDYAIMGISNVTIIAAVGYLEIGFTAGAGTLAAGASTGEIQTRVNKIDWSSYYQANDFSFDPTITVFQDYGKVALFNSGTIVWGRIDDGKTPTPTIIVITPTPTKTATPVPTPTPNYTAGPVGPTPGPTKISALGAGSIRVNQAGYFAGDNYKVAYAAALTGTFQVMEYGTNIQWWQGTLTSIGTDSLAGEALYLADFSAFARPGKYYIRAGAEWSPKFEIKEDLYNEVLYYTLRVYGANRCGPYDSWIHEDCHTLDGSIRGTGKEGSLVGGWHDCGDHVKFGTTLGYVSCMMLFSYNAWPNKFGDVYSMQYDGTYKTAKPDGIPDVLNEVKVGTDYLLNLYNASVEDGLIAVNKMYYQVGDGDDDHSWWNKPEYQDAFEQAKGGAPREIYSDIGSDLCGRYSASLSMMSIAYKTINATYAASCLTAAKAMYSIGKAIYGQAGDTGQKSYYQMDTRSDDDLALAAVELFKATGTSTYLDDVAYWMAVENKWQFASFYVLSYPNVFDIALYEYYPFASTVDNDPPVVDTVIVTKAECIEWLKLDTAAQQTLTGDLYGRKWQYDWGTCRYMMGIATTAALAYDLDNTALDMLKIAKDQMNWIFGCNQFGMSFVVGNTADGWLTKYPLHPHHRAANPDGANVPTLPIYAATELTGGTIGGPSAHTVFSDKWDDYTSTETGIDYWAGTFVTAAFFAKAVR